MIKGADLPDAAAMVGMSNLLEMYDAGDKIATSFIRFSIFYRNVTFKL